MIGQALARQEHHTAFAITLMEHLVVPTFVLDREMMGRRDAGGAGALGGEDPALGAHVRSSGSVRAPTQYQSAKWAEVVHIFWPFRM